MAVFAVVASLAVLSLGVATAATLILSPWSDDVSVTTASADPEGDRGDKVDKGDEDERVKLGVPTNLSAEAIDHETVRVAWNPVENAEGYQVERDGEVVAEEVAEVEYLDTGLEADTTYDYRIRAYGTATEVGRWSSRHKLHGRDWPQKKAETAAETDTDPDADELSDDPSSQAAESDADGETEDPSSGQGTDSDGEAQGSSADADPGPALEPVSCDYHAAPSASGAADGSSQEDAFLIADFWDVAQPGTALCLVDGTYTGSDSMIEPPSGLSGTEGQPITITASNDGEVLIDGETRERPIRLAGNSWFVIQGLNAANSSSNVVHLSSGADNNVLRRIVAWDAEPSGNTMVFRLNGNDGNLLEDTAGFGSARKTYQSSQSGNNNTFRRAWAMWNFSSTSSVKQTYSIAYNAVDNTCENCIGTFDADAGAYPENRRGILSNNKMSDMDSLYSNSGYWGSIAYTLRDQDVSELRGQLESFRIHEGVTLENVVAYTENADLRTARLRADSGQDDKIYRHGTEIGPGGDSIADGWEISGRVKVDSVEEAPSVWNGSAEEGARVCHRYVDRELTDEPLWPWPMNQRIIDALTLAGREPVDVTATMEDLFGTIPAECRGS